MAPASVRVAPDVFSREFDDEVVLLDLRGGEYYALNQTGTTLWSLITNGHESPEEQLAALYGVPIVEARDDYEAFVSELLSLGLLVRERK